MDTYSDDSDVVTDLINPPVQARAGHRPGVAVKCLVCGRSMRPYGANATDYPGMPKPQNRELCSACYKRTQRGGGDSVVESAAFVPPPGEWVDDALCAQVDPEAFFPDKGGSTRDAKSICASCDVRAQCLDYALRTRQRFGIWGGLSERERRALLRRAA